MAAIVRFIAVSLLVFAGGAALAQSPSGRTVSLVTQFAPGSTGDTLCRIMADSLGVESIDRDARTVVLKFRPQARIDPVRLVNLVRQRADLTLVPPSALKMNLEAPVQPPSPSAHNVPAPGAGQAAGRGGQPPVPRVLGRPSPPPPSPSGGRRAGGPGSKTPPPARSAGPWGRRRAAPRNWNRTSGTWPTPPNPTVRPPASSWAPSPAKKAALQSRASITACFAPPPAWPCRAM